MAYAFIAVMLGLWLLGMATSHLFGGLLHLLLGVAVAMVLYLIEGRRPTVQE